MQTIQDKILAALTAPANAQDKKSSVTLQTAVARIKGNATMSKWKYALRAALKKGHYKPDQLTAMVGHFEKAVETTGDYEKCFLWAVETYGNSDAQKELLAAKASFVTG